MATLSWILDVNSPNAARTFDEISTRMTELDRNLKRTREIAVGDKQAMATFARLQLQADRFSDRIHNMPLTIEGAARAEAQLLGLEATADRLNTKLNVDVSGRRFTLGNIGRAAVSRQGLVNLFKGGGGGGGGAAGTFLGIPTDFLASPGGIASIGALSLPLSALIDALAGQGIGTGVGLAGFYGAKKYDAKQLAPGLQSISQGLAPVFKSIGPSIGLMLAQLGRFTKGERNPLAQLFASSLPFLQQFIKLAEIAAKTILPSLTQVMRQMVSSGALKEMTQGFVFLIQGLAAFIRELGPGFKAGAMVFRAVALGIRDLLIGLGQVFGGLGGAAGHAFTWIRNEWDKYRHWQAGAFDTWRHQWAADWAQLWNNTIGRTIRGGHDLEAEFNTWRHHTANIFDGARHDIAHIWDLIWNNTVGRTQRGVHDVTGWFGRLPGMALGMLKGFGVSLWNEGKSVMTFLWNGIKAGVRPITGFLSGFAHGVVEIFKKIWGWFSPSSVMYAAGRDLMLGLFHGIRDHAHKAQNAFRGALHPTGSGATVQRLMQSMAASVGWTGAQWQALNNVEMREAGYNLTARNPSSGAYGLAQFINGPAEYYQYGGNPNTARGQIIGMFNYIRQRYGTPAAAWAHELSAGWYDRGGWLRPGLTLAMNATGQPERILPPGGEVGRSGHGGQLFGDLHIHSPTDEQLLMQKINYAIVSAGFLPAPGVLPGAATSGPNSTS